MSTTLVEQQIDTMADWASEEGHAELESDCDLALDGDEEAEERVRSAIENYRYPGIEHVLSPHKPHRTRHPHHRRQLIPVMR